MKKILNMFFSGVIIIMVYIGSVVDIDLIVKALQDDMVMEGKIICIAFCVLIEGVLVGIGIVGIKAIWED